MIYHNVYRGVYFFVYGDTPRSRRDLFIADTLFDFDTITQQLLPSVWCLMDVPQNASDLIIVARFVDRASQPVTGVAFDDPSLSLLAFSYGSEGYQPLTLEAGTLGVYAENSWVEIGAGDYQFCPANDLIVPGRQTTIRLAYLDTVIYGQLNAVGESTGAATTISDIANKLAGITRLSSWLRALLRRDPACAVAMNEINVGDGEYDPTQHSQAAIAAEVVEEGGKLQYTADQATIAAKNTQ